MIVLQVAVLVMWAVFAGLTIAWMVVALKTLKLRDLLLLNLFNGAQLVICLVGLILVAIGG